MMKKFLTLAAIALIGAGCSASQPSASPVQPTEPTPVTEPTSLDAQPAEASSKPEAREIVVTGDNFAFDVKEIKAKKGEKLRIVFKNKEGFHDWKIDAFNAATPKLQAGKEAAVEFTVDKTGTFEFYCSIGSHRAMGMKGSLIVE